MERGELFIAIEIKRGLNAGTVIRCAAAFNASLVILIGSSNYSTYGAHGAQRYVRTKHFYYWEDFFKFSQRYLNCQIIGILPQYDGFSSISEDKVSIIDSKPTIPIDKLTFRPNTCFVVVDESISPLSTYSKYCETFTYIPIPDMNKQKFVQIDAKLCIGLQQYTCQYPTTFVTSSFENGKFYVQEKTSTRSLNYLNSAENGGDNDENDEKEENDEELEEALEGIDSFLFGISSEEQE